MICVDFLCVWIGHLKCYSSRRSWKLRAKESAMASHFGSRPRERFKCSAGKSGGAKNLGSSVEARTLREGKGPGGAECRNEWQLQRIRMAFHWVDRFTVVVGGGPANVGLRTKENMAACCSPPWQVTTICSSGCRRMLASRTKWLCATWSYCTHLRLGHGWHCSALTHWQHWSTRQLFRQFRVAAHLRLTNGLVNRDGSSWWRAASQLMTWWWTHIGRRDAMERFLCESLWVMVPADTWRFAGWCLGSLASSGTPPQGCGIPWAPSWARRSCADHKKSVQAHRGTSEFRGRATQCPGHMSRNEAGFMFGGCEGWQSSFMIWCTAASIIAFVPMPKGN